MRNDALVLDQALLGIRRGGLQLQRNTLFAVAKLGALPLVAIFFAHDGGMAIYATWVGGQLASLAWLAGITWRSGEVHGFWPPEWAVLRRLGRTAIEHHLLNLALQLTSLAMPLVVTAMLSVRQNAYFYAAWMIAGFVFVGPLALSIALFAVGAQDRAALAQRLRFTLALAFIVGLLGNAALLIGADRVLGAFGQSYADQATTMLHIVGLGVFPLIIKDHYVTVRRLQGNLRGAAFFVAAGSLLELLLAALGARLAGMPGLGFGWLLALGIEATLMAYPVYRAAIPRPATERAANLPPDGNGPLF